jgi:hypothetical protein
MQEKSGTWLGKPFDPAPFQPPPLIFFGLISRPPSFRWSDIGIESSRIPIQRHHSEDRGCIHRKRMQAKSERRTAQAAVLNSVEADVYTSGQGWFHHELKACSSLEA